jgi:hypothetical protein
MTTTFPVLTVEATGLKPAASEAVSAYAKNRNYIDKSAIECVLVFDKHRDWQFAQDRVTGNLYLVLLRPNA